MHAQQTVANKPTKCEDMAREQIQECPSLVQLQSSNLN